MDKNQRPHSRKKTYGSGTSHVGKGRKVSTGGPVGFGGRTGSSSSGSSGSSYGSRAGGGLNLKSLITLVVIVLVAVFVLKNCGGLGFLSGLLGSGFDDLSGYTDLSSNFSSDSGSSAVVSASDSSPDLTVSDLSRDHHVTLKGNGNDIVNVMIYMCGTDLESKYGMATKDIQEMINATISDKVNVIIETGGCKKWQNNVFSNSTNQIYKLEDAGLKKLVDNAGKASMTDPDNLTDFIKYCSDNYPDATRNILIFWDHGGGSITGYGYDEKNPSSSSMTLNKISSALKKADCKFDFIGFDACLMATLENAFVCNDYADYLLASEESEPGTGWYYTNWMTKLSKNTSISTVELSKTIIDDFVAASCQASPNAQVTLSIIDLAELQGTVPESFTKFASSTTELLKTDDYKKVSDARAGARQFAATSRINQVDLVDLANRIGTSESKALSKALTGCIKYNKSTIPRSYGVSIYFPYETTNTVKSAVASLNNLSSGSAASSCMGEYTKTIQSFASLEMGGQIAGSASQSPFGGLDLGSLLSGYTGSGGSSTSPLTALTGALLGGNTGSSSGSSGSYTGSSSGMSIDPSSLIGLLSAFSGRSMPAEYDWVDTELIADQAENIVDNYLDPGRLIPTEKDGKKVLSLTDEEWGLVQTVELSVYVNDGDGFIDLGLDNTFEWYGDDLLLEYDGTWLALNGYTCAYYLESDEPDGEDSWSTVGRIPALLNDKFVYLQVVFNDDNPEGAVTGAQPMYEDEADVQAKGDIEIRKGDKIELLCDYYDLDGKYDATYSLGTTFTVHAAGLVLENIEIDNEDLSVMYRITDIYGNHYWVPVE